MSTLLSKIKMETFRIEYSNKNIPIPPKEEYMLSLISKVENLLKRMRWKALAFLDKLPDNNTNNYGFRSQKCPSTVEELAGFEEDMVKMIKNIEFKAVRDEFQQKL